jgi:hypothetical protein
VDEDGSFLNRANALSVTVNNVAPTVTFSAGNDTSVDEGTTHTYSYAVTDPGQDTFTVDAGYPKCGTGGELIVASISQTATGGSFDCFFPEGPATTSLAIKVTDSDGASDTDSESVQVVQIANVAPTVAFTTAPSTANDGETKTYSFSITDPGADTQSYASSYPSCGDNGTVTGTPTITNSGGSFQCTFSAAGGTSSTVSVKVFDGSDNSNTASQSVTINRGPTTDAGPNGSGNEGSAIALDGTVTDPEGDSFTVKWTYTAGAGVDAGATCSFANDTAVDTTITCTDDGTYTAKLEATDSKGAKSSDTTTVTVSNANPAVTISSPVFGALYAKTATTNPTVSVSSSFTDAGKNDTHKAPAGGSCTVSWDDGTADSTGTVTETPQSGSGSCTASHAYTTPGVYTIRVTVTDDDGGSGFAETMVVVYDASAGFVTGGGWIQVGKGSYSANLDLEGRANFGFNSQYKKGATVPTGNVEFQFQIGNLNFHSENFSWLVVSGFKAQFRGNGTINGDGNYDFTLTAYDGQIGGTGQTGSDRFRIVITDHTTGAVVFDNRIGASMDMDSANPQNIAGGSIVIHKA